MSHKLNTDRTAAVSLDAVWLKIDEHTPIGSRMQLIDKKQNIAFTRVHHKGDGFTHWFPVPKWEI